MEFISPTKGRMTFTQVFEEIIAYASENPEDNYRLIVGTDSQLREETCFVTALIVHRQEGRKALLYPPTTAMPFAAAENLLCFLA